MKFFNAVSVSESKIELMSINNIMDLYKTISGDDNFIICWKTSNGEKLAKLVVSNNISSKVQNGEIEICSREKIKGDEKNV